MSNPGRHFGKKNPSPRKLQAHKWLKSVESPAFNWFALMRVQETAMLTPMVFEVIQKIRAKRLDVILPNRPDYTIWNDQYRDHRSVQDGVAGFLGDELEGWSSQSLDAVQLLSTDSTLTPLAS